MTLFNGIALYLAVGLVLAILTGFKQLWAIICGEKDTPLEDLPLFTNHQAFAAGLISMVILWPGMAPWVIWRMFRKDQLCEQCGRDISETKRCEPCLARRARMALLDKQIAATKAEIAARDLQKVELWLQYKELQGEPRPGAELTEQDRQEMELWLDTKQREELAKELHEQVDDDGETKRLLRLVEGAERLAPWKKS